MSKQYLNPEALFNSRQYGFSQIVAVSAGKLVFMSGQVAWDENQQVAGPNDLGIQTRRSLENVGVAVRAAGGAITDIVSLRIYILHERMAESRSVREALLDFFPPDAQPASTWIGVQSLANKDFLVEIEAIAVIAD